MKRQRPAISANPALRAEEYQLLVDELMKDQPDQALIRKLMLQQGIPYTPDPISQMSLVLHSMSQAGLKAKDPTLL